MRPFSNPTVLTNLRATTINDYNSNITRVMDELRSLEQMSALYTMDNLNRVIAADQGVLLESSGNFTVDDNWRWRKENWTLSQTGNWLAHNIGTNSAANNALVETGTFNTANEWTARSRTVPGTASDTPVYDKVGNLINDGKGLAYKYDGLGRLREVRLTGESHRLKTAYRYNGLGMRITHAINMSEGTSDDDVTDSGDPVTYFAYDERWRVAGAWVSSANTTPSSSTPTERWIHHAAGFGGRGGSSYIDSVVLRDRDVVTSGGSATSTSDGGSDALEERIYVLQNWRADVVATVGRTGTLIEWMQYTAYGSAITNPPGNADFNGDGIVDESDTEAFFDAFTAGLLSADVNNDGSVTGDDVEAFDEIWDAGLYPTPGLCSFTAIRIGYAGYQWDGSVNIASERAYTGAMAGLYHVRHRVYDPEMGRWTRRDPIGYVDGMGLYQYIESKVVVDADPTGLNPAIGLLPVVNRFGFRRDLLASLLLSWYFNGNGAFLDLTNVFPAFSYSYLNHSRVAPVVAAIKASIEAKTEARGRMLSTQLKCCQPPGPEEISHVSEGSMTMFVSGVTPTETAANFAAGVLPGVWVMGGHTIRANYVCGILVSCGNTTSKGWFQMTYMCNINLRALDLFTEPFNVDGLEHPQGDPYLYTFSWSDWTGKSLKFGSWDASRCVRPN